MEKKRFSCLNCGTRSLGTIERKYCSRECFLEHKRRIRKKEETGIIWDLVPIFLTLIVIGTVYYFMVR